MPKKSHRGGVIMWNFTEDSLEALVGNGYERTTAVKTITSGGHKGQWRLMWNGANGGVWARIR